MKKHIIISILGSLVVLVTSQAPAQNEPDDEEEIQELSPFVTDESGDVGYMATNTLAGSRLDTPIENIGAAISVYNEEFMSDINATDHNELLIYATGMEAAGSQGNTSGAVRNDLNVSTTTTREDPEGGAGFGQAIRSRGFAGPTRTRGFFRTDIRTDNYNVDRTTVNRGPNAILFGVANPAGIIDIALKQAQVHRNFNKLEFQLGDNETFRGTFDANRVLLEDKLAVRVNGLFGRNEFDQRPAFEERRRIYGAVTYKPFKSTIIRGNFERGTNVANRIFTIPPRMDFGPWLEDGKEVFDWTFFDDPARNPDAADQNANNQVPITMEGIWFGTRVTAVTADSKGRNAITSGFQNGNRQLLPFNEDGQFHPVFNRDEMGDNFQMVTTRGITDMPNAWFPNSERPPGLRPQTFTDTEAFDWVNQQFQQNSFHFSSLHHASIILEQRVLQDRVGVELVYDFQAFQYEHATAGEPDNAISIDTNVVLPTGEPNPNLGRPMVNADNNQFVDAFFERESFRATAFAKYDFRDLNNTWGKWLGSHTVTGLAERSAEDDLRGLIRHTTDGPSSRAIFNNMWNNRRKLNHVTYVGPSIVGSDNAQLRIQPITTPVLRAGDTIPTQAWNPDTQSMGVIPETVTEIRQGGDVERDVIKSLALVLQSQLLDDHVVTLFGWREDRDYFDSEALRRHAFLSRDNPNDGGDIRVTLDEFELPRTPDLLDENSTFTYSIVGKWPTKLFPLPGNMRLSVFFNDSENFTPSSGRTDNFQEPITSPTGETEEWGFNLSAFENRLNIRANHFETAIVNQPIITGGVATTVSETGVVRNVAGWLREGNNNPDNVAFMDAAVDAMLSPLPSDFLDQRNFTITTEDGQITTDFDRPQSTDTTDFVAEGWEVEMVFNPTPNFRMLGNFTRQKTVQSNILPNTESFLGILDSVINTNITDPNTGATVALGDIPFGGFPEDFGPDNLPDPTLAEPYRVWLDNNIRFPLLNLQAGEGEQASEQRKWRANLVMNYTFSGERFGNWIKGFGLGGGARWQGESVIGYPSRLDENGVVQFDLDNPFTADSELNVDLWYSYERPIFNERVNWKLRLNFKNPFGDEDLIPIKMQPDGSVATVRIPPDKRWFLTSTFEF